MTSLDKLQQTIELLNAVRGASVGVQSMIQKVKSTSIKAFDILDKRVVDLYFSVYDLLETLRAALRISPKVVIKPIVSVVPAVDFSPKLNIVADIKLVPKLSVAPVVSLNPQLNIAPTVNVTPQLNVSPKLNINPELNVSPKLNISPELNVSPKLNINPELNVSPKLNISPELNVSPKLNIKPELNIKPALNFEPELNIKPALNFEPQLNIKPAVNFEPEFNLSPTFNFEPKVKVAPKVSIVGKIFGALKGSVMAFISIIRTAALTVFSLLRASILSVIPPVIAFGVALLANPITWIVLGIIALIAALVGLIVYWDEVTEAVGNFFSGLGDFASMEIFEPLKVWWNDFTTWLSSLDPFAMIAEGWEWIKSLFTDNAFIQTAFSPLKLIGKLVDGVIGAFKKIPQWWNNFKKWLADLNPLGKVSEGIKKLGSWIGFGGKDSDAEEAIDKSVVEQKAMTDNVKLPGADVMQSTSGDNLMQTVSNEFAGAQKKTHVEKIEVHNHSTGVSGADLAYEMEMAAG